MSKTILGEIDGFTMVIDDLVLEYDFMTAAVFGRVWRYCQMEQGRCCASINTMSTAMGISRITFMDKLEKLVLGGYLRKETETIGKVNRYYDTGKAGMRFSLVAGIDQTYKENIQGVSKNYTGGVKKFDTKKEEESNKKEKPVEPVIAFPDKLNCTEFMEAWIEWDTFRSETKHKLTPTTIKKQLAMLAEYSVETAIATINQSIEHGWQGLFPIKTNGNNHNENGQKSVSNARQELLDRI